MSLGLLSHRDKLITTAKKSLMEKKQKLSVHEDQDND